MPLAELTVIPMAGSQMRPVVDRAIRTIKESGIKYEVGAVGTTLEGTLEQILAVAKQAHLAALDEAKDRVITDLRIDQQPNGKCTIAHDTAPYR